MGEKKFIVESVMITNDCNEDKRIVKVITDKEELYSYDDLYEISGLLNEQQTTIERLKKDNEKLQKENNNLTNNIKDMVDHLRMEYNHASSQRSKYVDDVYVEKAYNIVRLSIYRALRILGCDE